MVTKCRLDRKDPCERRDEIIAVAAEVFFEVGYGASSMATIAARLGGSKATLYKYFPSKEALFEAMMEQRSERVLAPLRELRGGDAADLEAMLIDFGERFMTKIYDPHARDVSRLVSAEGARFPELARTFFRAGPDQVIDELGAALGRFRASGQIACDDVRMAASQFIGMLLGQQHMRYVSGVIDAPDPATIAMQARHAARVFARGMAAASPAASPAG